MSNSLVKKMFLKRELVALIEKGLKYKDIICDADYNELLERYCSTTDMSRKHRAYNNLIYYNNKKNKDPNEVKEEEKEEEMITLAYNREETERQIKELRKDYYTRKELIESNSLETDEAVFHSNVAKESADALFMNSRLLRSERERFILESHDKQKELEEDIASSREELLAMESQIDQIKNVFIKEHNELLRNATGNGKEYIEKMKIILDSLCRAFEIKMRAHKHVLIEYRQFMIEWNQATTKQLILHNDAVYKTQQAYAGIIANDRSLVEAGYIRKIVEEESDLVTNITIVGI